MILLDANLLIYSVNADARQFKKAKAWLEKTIGGRETVGLPWNVMLACLRLTTRPGVFRQTLPVEQALEIVAEWLEQDNVTIPHPGPKHLRILNDLLLHSGTGGNLTSDAHLAALAIEHGAVLCSLDRE